MKNVMLAEPTTIALFGLGVLLLLLLMMLLGAIIFLIVRFSRKSRKPVPPSASPVAPATQIIPRKCPQCGAELKPEVSEGLCPACLLQRGIATEGGAPPGTPPFVPPTIPDLAKLFPQLEILELIGKGGMGAVYKARQPALDRFVALKILAPRAGGDLDFASRFTREARALAKLNHPNIVGVYDFGIVGQASSLSPSEKKNLQSETGRMPVPLHYFIMEYVDGPNLRQIEQAGKLPPREALAIIPQICAALQFAHDEGIVHRDIKPENILLDKKGRVKIADFGLAKILGQEPKDFRLTGVRDVVGTPHYMAPEQVEKPQMVDHRADIYSLGVVFYEMLTGELPLGKFQPPSTCARGVQIDVRLDEVVLHALEKAPERRYQQASQVKTDVETIAGSPGAVKEAVARTEMPPQSKRPRMQRWISRLGVGLTILTVLILLGMFLSNSLPRRTASVTSVIAQSIQHEVGRQLREAGASYDNLQVTIAAKRDSATPFRVSYRGLRNFKWGDGATPAADGEFIMEYIGGGHWQGKLGGMQFTVTVGQTDDFTLPFVNDPQVIGEWESVDFVANPSDFNPDKPSWEGELYLKGLTFQEDGKTSKPWWTWTKGIVIHHGDKTASHYEIREIKGQSYLFLEWKSGDVMVLGMKPSYYVLKRKL